MIKHSSIIVLSIAVMLTALSCKKDSEGNIVTKMSAKVDGSSWNPLTNVTVLANNMFTITSTSFTGELILITINGATTGTYNLNILPPAAQCACTYKSSILDTSQDWFISVSGSVVISKIDQTAKTISGTFQFSLIKGLSTTKSITNGAFNNLIYTQTN